MADIRGLWRSAQLRSMSFALLELTMLVDYDHTPWPLTSCSSTNSLLRQLLNRVRIPPLGHHATFRCSCCGLPGSLPLSTCQVINSDSTGSSMRLKMFLFFPTVHPFRQLNGPIQPLPLPDLQQSGTNCNYSSSSAKLHNVKMQNSKISNAHQPHESVSPHNSDRNLQGQFPV